MTLPAADRIVRGALVRDVPLEENAQVGFQPPDAAWRQHVEDLLVDGNHVSSLNVYLVDLLENERRRSNEPTRIVTDGVVSETPAPFWVDCHYLVSAWYPTADSDAIIATRREHMLLSRALRALVRNAPLNPGRVLSDEQLAFVAPALQDADLPTRIVPAEGFAKLAEFWGGMGDDIRWRPVVHVVLSIPVLYAEDEAGGVVETIVTELGRRRRGSLDGSEILVTAGGVVVDVTGAPVPFARVELRTAAGESVDRVTAAADGRFVLAGMRPGTYGLTWSANGFAPPAAPLTIDVPSSGGHYELQFT